MHTILGSFAVILHVLIFIYADVAIAQTFEMTVKTGLIEKINHERSQKKLPKLEWSELGIPSGLRLAQDNLARNQALHRDSDGRILSPEQPARGTEAKALSEVAALVRIVPTSDASVAIDYLWYMIQNSKAHYDTLMDPNQFQCGLWSQSGKGIHESKSADHRICANCLPTPNGTSFQADRQPEEKRIVSIIIRCRGNLK